MREEGQGAGLSQIAAWIFGRLGIPILASVAVLLWAGGRAQESPLPPPVGGNVIVDEQMRRSHALEPVDVLILGDSSGLLGIDPVRLGERLGRDVRSLSAIGPVRGTGFVHLLRNHLARATPPDAIVLAIHPFSLMSPWRQIMDLDLTGVVEAGRWPSPGYFEGARAYLDQVALGGWLDEPLPTAWGVYYGNASSLRRFLRNHRGGLVDPLPTISNVPDRVGSVQYTLHEDGRALLEEMRDMLAGLDARRLFVLLTPVPSHMAREHPEETRDALLAEVLAVLALSDEQGLRLPHTLPASEMTGPTHASEAGRRTLTGHLADALANSLERR